MAFVFVTGFFTGTFASAVVWQGETSRLRAKIEQEKRKTNPVLYSKSTYSNVEHDYQYLPFLIWGPRAD